MNPLRSFVLGVLFLSALTSFAQKPVAATEQKPSFTLEQVMSSPFPSNLTTAARANRIAWVFNGKGERNVWIADAPRFDARPITRYQGDDGQDIFTLKLTPDGKTAVFARGSELSEGHVANPASELKEPKQQVWAVDVESGQSRLLGEMGCNEEDCQDIQLSPDGHWAVWIGAKQHLWMAPVAGDKPARQLTELRGEESEPHWSPDGKHLAFTSNRKDHSFIAVLDLNDDAQAQRVHYLSPSVDRDFAPRWSPDAKQLIFLRTGGREEHLPAIPLRPHPWAIWRADSATGEARELWHSGTAINDSLPPDAAESLQFVGDKIVFCSEQDGHNHLYAISVYGGGAVLLTPGDFDVEDVEASGGTILFTSNQGDIERRHVWSVGLGMFESGHNFAPTKPEPLSKGAGMEWHPVILADGKTVVCLGSSATSPAMPYILTDKGREMIAANVLPKDFPSSQLVEPQTVAFKSEDGLEIHGQLFLPRGVKAGSNPTQAGPALIFVHGGPMRQMMPGFHYMYYYHNAYAENQYLASLGYAVLSVNYRLGVMYGRAFRQPADGGWRGSSEYRDVVAGAKYLRTLPYVDAKRVGIWGGSYGGLLTALALSRNSDLFAAGVDFHGVHDWSVLRRHDVADAPDSKEALKLAFDSSPVATVERWKSPVLLIHGDDDRNVPFQQTTDLVQRLRKQGVRFEEIIFPDEIHDFLLWKDWIRGYQATADFFNRKLKIE